MGLSDYHIKYASLPDEEIENRAKYKKEELLALCNELKLETNSQSCDVAVMGCGDKRLIAKHQEIFSEFCGRPVKIITFDVTIDHLSGANNVIQHDCIDPLPGGPYDIVYGHVLLRFIHPDHQWGVIKNTYDVLKPGGLSIQILDFLDFTTESKRLPNGLYSVPLRKYEEQMDAEGMTFIEVTAKKGLVLAIRKPH
jgi:SAM-dependent methyltransferase